MNSTPRSPTNINFFPPEFQQVIQEKCANFVGREFIFTAISEFLHRHNRGYFTIVGAPGSGKSAILAKYVTENPDIVYYNAQLEGKNRADEFLKDVCQQIVETLHVTSLHPLPDNATEGSRFLSLLLQKISVRLAPNQRLIIAVDALDAIDRNSQALGSNLFYLPRYLPERVYFLLTRRPFLKEKSGLLIETPFQTLDLGEYPEQNREDVQVYIHRTLAEADLVAESNQNINEEELCNCLTNQSENNFMYVSQIINAITSRFYPEPFQFIETEDATSLLPPSLIAYYQQHWQKMLGQGLSAVELGVLRVLTRQFSYDSPCTGEGISTQAIAQMIYEEEYEVQQVLENWLEFLQQQQVGGETRYSLYHWSFRDWLGGCI